MITALASAPAVVSPRPRPGSDLAPAPAGTVDAPAVTGATTAVIRAGQATARRSFALQVAAEGAYEMCRDVATVQVTQHAAQLSTRSTA